MKVAVIRYPGSNCDIETLRYFSDLGESFYIWHSEYDYTLLDNVGLLVLPGGFAFGDRLYDKATDSYTISPGTMALDSPVNQIIIHAAKLNIPIIGICNGFQILTQCGLLPGKLILNDSNNFESRKEECIFNYNDIEEKFTLSIANSYGKYVIDNESSEKYDYFLRYSNGNIAGVYNKKTKIFGMMPHPERNINNIDFKEKLYNMLFDSNDIISQITFDKCIQELMFSEHISYKTTRKYLKKLHTQENWVVQGPGENAGIVDIGKSDDGTEYCIAIRIESHNHPTFIDPFEGAATGVGGILRDIFTMGARPIGILDFLRFGTNQHSEHLLQNAINGISYYGNCVGVPNLGGDLYLHNSYDKNPLVNVGCLGIVKKKNIIYGNALSTKSVLLYVGSKTGNEGINGAAMASKTFENNLNSDELKDNVQKSDPFLEKLLLEACCEIADKKLAEGMQDMGAGGLLCASLEVIKRGREKINLNLGVQINLESVPTKYPMEHHNILISESQERMLIVCNEVNIDKICEIFRKWDLEYSVIGTTNNSGSYSVYYDNTKLYSKPMTSFNDINDYSNLPNSQSNVAHAIKIHNMKQWEVYDSTVGNRTIKGPDKPGSYSILDIYELNKQLILTWGESFDECKIQMRKFEGVKPLCIVNCLNFGDPKDSLQDFKNTIDNLTYLCKENHIPVVGGNVSLYNTTGDTSIRPTPIILMMGITN